MYLCPRNYDLSRGGTFETAKAGTFHSVTAGTLIPLSAPNAIISQIAGTVFDGDANDFNRNPVQGAEIFIGRFTTITDERGHFMIELPLEEQDEVKPVIIRKNGYKTFTREEESPGSELTYLLHRH